MKVRVLVDIGEIPRSADDWELYTNSTDCTDAAVALTNALEEAIEGCASGDMTAYEAYRTHFYPVARKHIDEGACDSEPTDKATMILEKIQALTTRRRPW